ncbi:S-glutathione dehydrogenase [Cercophora samala]|uniref:S-glutathione dehydrogenase n=1 Tax=Cercophora samala TaxID=330535 RepID=A0AA40CS34_9PEZI|nr:S-glutathione dehydrogenase [Cercophora samala]
MINECLYPTKKFGRVGIIGDYVGFTNHLNVGAIMELGIYLIECGQAPVQRCMVQKWEVDPTIMLTHRFKIEDIAKAYKLQEKREEGLIKCFVETRFSTPHAEGTPELTNL